MTSLRVTAETLLETASGPRAAVAVQPGETLALGPGLAATIRFAGRTVLVRDAGDRALWPITVPADSLGPGLPATDLYVAPDQVLPLAGGLGAPARALVDGSVIRRTAPDGPIDMVELHLAAPLAEPAPADRLPALVEALAGTRLPPPGPPQGSVDMADPTQASGWALDPARPGQPLLLTILVDGSPVAQVLADHYRADLDRTLRCGGHHGFHVAFAPNLSRGEYHRVALRRACDGAPIAGPARLIDRAPTMEAAYAALANATPEVRAQALSAALLALGEAARG